MCTLLSGSAIVYASGSVREKKNTASHRTHGAELYGVSAWLPTYYVATSIQISGGGTCFILEEWVHS